MDKCERTNEAEYELCGKLGSGSSCHPSVFEDKDAPFSLSIERVPLT